MTTEIRVPDRGVRGEGVDRTMVQARWRSGHRFGKPLAWRSKSMEQPVEVAAPVTGVLSAIAWPTAKPSRPERCWERLAESRRPSSLRCSGADGARRAAALASRWSAEFSTSMLQPRASGNVRFPT